MKKLTGALCGLLLTAGMLQAHAADTSKNEERLTESANIINEVMSTPDKAIPQSILAGAHCVVVIPAVKKLAFAVGGEYGRGVGTCRTGHGWSAPVFMKLAGGSFGFQIGGQSTDLVLVGMNQKSLQDMIKAKFKIGADISAAAGPVGRNAQASTDILLNAEFLTYSRAKGLFAGVDLNGAVLDADDEDLAAEYGPGVRNDAVLHGSVPPPANAQRFVHTVAKYFVISKENH